MSRGVLYPGITTGTNGLVTSGTVSEISTVEDWTSNFFTIPYKYYENAAFMNTVDSDGVVKPPESYKMGYDDLDVQWDDGSVVTADSIVRKMHKSLNIGLDGNPMTTFRKQTLFYNRFKVPDPNDTFQKGFPHVFFVRPSCNLFESDNQTPRSEILADSAFRYAWYNSPDLLYQLTSKSPNMDHDWMYYLSNKAGSFSLSDQYIEVGTYGKTWTGYSISYGKHDIASKTSGEFTIKYTDDRNLHVYHLHKLWEDYISQCYRGVFQPTSSNIFNKIRDYATSVYYIVTAEDGETIIFWSKYYGVFPTTLPSTHLSWSEGQVISKQDFDITYRYSMKEDFNPLALIEFNTNTRMKKTVPYIATYDPCLGHVGDTWVGAPFIEVIDNRATDQYCEDPYTFKLRFKTPNINENELSVPTGTNSTVVSDGTVGIIPHSTQEATNYRNGSLSYIS